MTDRHQLELAIAAQEGLRGAVPDEVIDLAVAALRDRLATLDRAEPRRRQVTVLFADVSGFTAMSERLDAEVVAEVMNELWGRLDAVLTAHGGRIDKHLGDGVMAVWGALHVREDDPAQAVRAGLELQRTLQDLGADSAATITMRVGIATGPALLGPVGATDEFTVMGDTVNVASRLEAAAPIGGVLISPETYGRIRDRFEVRSLPPLQLKGKVEPLDAYVVTGAERARSRLAPRFEGLETRMVGREAEHGRLRDAWATVVDESTTMLVTVTGEAGAGKSRLVYELGRWIAERDGQRLPAVLEGRAAPAQRAAAMGLVRAALGAHLGIHDSDAAGTVTDKLHRGLAPALDADAADVAGHWLGFDLSSSATVQRVAASDHFGTIATDHLVRFLGSFAPQPLLLLLEDLQWADEESLDVVDVLLEHLREKPVLVVATARPSFAGRRPEWWRDHPRRASCELAPLSAEATDALVRDLLRRVDEPDPTLVDLVVERSDGNAFYVEELVRMLIDTGVIEVVATDAPWLVHREKLDAGRIPPTLAGVLQARLDGLPAGQRTALQRAAVIGRVFWDDAVVALGPEPSGTDPGPASDPDIWRELEGRELVLRRDRSTFDGCSELAFRHGLLREVAYETVLLRDRRELHERAARWLERRAADRAGEYAAVIADHFDHAGNAQAAATWYLEAGRQAASRHGYQDALRALGRALELLPPTDVTARFDALLVGDDAHNRLGDRDAQRAGLAELLTLAPGVDAPRRTQLLLRRCRLAWFVNDLDEVVTVAAEVVADARADGRIEEEATGLLWWGKGLTWLGRNEEADPLFVAAAERAARAGRSRLVGEALRFRAIVANNTGRFEEAVHLAEAAIAQHRAIGDLDGEAQALGQLGAILSNQGDYEAARTAIEASRTACEQSGYRYGVAVNTSNLAVTDLALGRIASARALTEESLVLSAAIEDHEGVASAHNNLGDLYRRVGDWSSARRELQDSIEVARAIDNGIVLADSEALLALVELAEHRDAAALQLAEDAVLTARELGVPLTESRALIVTAYVHRAAGRPHEAMAAFVAADAVQAQLGLGDKAGLESRAGRAALELSMGQTSAALATIGGVAAQLDAGVLEAALVPGEVLLACYDVLHAANDARTADVAALAGSWLDERLGRLDDDLRAGFLRVPANQALARTLGRAKATARGGA